MLHPLLLLLLGACGDRSGDSKDGGNDADCDTPPSWYRDSDGDSFGDPSTSTTACRRPDGFVADGTDCDDAVAAINPDATERCDPTDTDEDCNGLSDLDDPGAELVPYHFDADEDGYGDPEVTEYACDPPAGFLFDGTDCDDNRADINPAATEFCDEADTDEDCDGLADDADDNVNTAGLDPVYPDEDGDGYGAGSAYFLCDPDGLVNLDGDCDDDEEQVNPGQGETCGDGLDNNCDGDDNGCTLEGTFALSDGSAVIRGEADDHLAESAWRGGDLTGDGIPDLVIGSTEMGSYGEARVFAGPFAGEIEPDDAYTVVSGSSSSNRGVGASVIGGHDWNGDGDADLFVGEPQSGTTDGLGAAYVFYGPLGTTERTSSADRTYRGPVSNAGVGSVLGAGDIDGDGTDDVALASAVVSGRTGYHQIFVDEGSLGSGTGALASSAEATITSDNYVTEITTGDMDGDGADEMLVGSEYEDNYTGGAWLIDGYPSGAIDLQGDATASVAGDGLGDRMGSSVALCDVTGDGTGDAVIGARYDSITASIGGAVYVFEGPWSGATVLRDSITTISGVESGDTLGSRVSCLGDVDGDGVEDLAVSAETADVSAGNTGAVYLFLDLPTGSATADAATVTIGGDDVSDQLILTGPLDDLTGDGRPELFVATRYANRFLSDQGALAVFSAGGI